MITIREWLAECNSLRLHYVHFILEAALPLRRSLTCIVFAFAAGLDYVGISRNLDFAPGVSMQTFRVVILDDLGQPILEGPEKFELVLRMPMNGILGEPSKATILINDTVSDRKKKN